MLQYNRSNHLVLKTPKCIKKPRNFRKKESTQQFLKRKEKELKEKCLVTNKNVFLRHSVRKNLLFFFGFPKRKQIFYARDRIFLYWMGSENNFFGFKWKFH